MIREWDADSDELPYCQVCDSVVIDPSRHPRLCHWCLLAGYEYRACGCLTQHNRMMEPCCKDHRLCETCNENPPQHKSNTCGPCWFAAEEKVNPVLARVSERR